MEDAEQNKLFVGGISWDTTEDALKLHFGKYGDVLGSVIARDRLSGQPRSFAFVTFSESSAVDRALEDSHQILSRTVEVKRAIPRSEQQSQQQQNKGLIRNNNNRTNSRNNDHFRTKKIFVGGLPANLTEEEFKSHFEKFGRITDVVVMHDNLTHRPRGFGFITFELEESVDEVMLKNFHELAGKLVEVKRAVPKDGISSSSFGYNGKIGGGRSPNFNSCQQDGYVPYNSRFGHFPVGYGNVAGYPYGTGMFGGGYPSGGYSGIGYALPPFAQRSPWNSAMVGVRGGFLPYGSAGPVYPTYLHGGPGVMGLSVNGYSGVFLGDAQLAADSTSSQTGTNNVDADSFGSVRSLADGASKQSRRVSDNRSNQGTNSS